MRKLPCALTSWKAKVHAVRDVIRPHGLVQTATELLRILDGRITAEDARAIQLTGAMECTRIGIPIARAFVLGGKVTSLLVSASFLDVVDYCTCPKGLHRFAVDEGAPMEDEEHPFCIGCVDGIRRQVANVEIVQ